VKEISLIIPAYNEEQTIKAVLDEVKKIKEITEIIVVDDGSVDNTYKIAKASEVRVIRHPYNKGYGAALKTGIRNAIGEKIIILDADGQHKSEDIKKILNNLDEYDMVVGCRTKGSYVPFSRRFGKFILSKVANYMAGFKIPDLNSGFRGFNKDKLLELMNILPNTYSFTTTVTLAFYKMGYSIKYQPISVCNRQGGRSRVRQVHHGFQTILLILRVIMLFNPLKVFVPVSIIIFSLGFVYAIVSFIFIQLHIPTGALLLMLTGILIFFFGLIADQISMLRFGKNESITYKTSGE